MRPKFLFVLAVPLFLAVAGARTQEEENVRVVLETLNVKAASFGGSEIIGEVVNESNFVIGFVEIRINVRDSSGLLLDTDFTFVSGVTVNVGSFQTNTGIFPGKTAVFSERIDPDLKDIDSIEYLVTFKVATPREDFDQTPLHERLSNFEAKTDSLYNELSNRIDNISSGSASLLPGDLDADGDVDFSDFLTFAQNFGTVL